MFLGNDLTTPNFWMYSFRAKKVMMLSDPKHLDHILPFMQPEGDVSVDVVTTRSKAASKLLASGELPALPDTSNSGEKVRE